MTTQLQITIQPYVAKLLSKFPTMVMEHRFGDNTHYLLLPSIVGQENKLNSLIDQITDVFDYQEDGLTLCVFTPKDAESVLLQNITLIGEYDKTTIFPKPKTSSKLKRRISLFLIGILMLTVLGAGIGYFIYATKPIKTPNIEQNSPIETSPELPEVAPSTEIIPETKTPSVIEETETQETEIFANQTETLKKDATTQNTESSTKDNVGNNYTLPKLQDGADNNLTDLRISKLTIHDLKTGMRFKNSTQQIELLTIDTNSDNLALTYHLNRQTLNGQITGESIRLEGLGAGFCFKNVANKVVFYLLPKQGERIILVEE